MHALRRRCVRVDRGCAHRTGDNRCRQDHRRYGFLEATLKDAHTHSPAGPRDGSPDRNRGDAHYGRAQLSRPPTPCQTPRLQSRPGRRIDWKLAGHHGDDHRDRYRSEEIQARRRAHLRASERPENARKHRRSRGESTLMIRRSQVRVVAGPSMRGLAVLQVWCWACRYRKSRGTIRGAA